MLFVKGAVDDLGAHECVGREEVEVEVVGFAVVRERPRDGLGDLVGRQVGAQNADGVGRAMKLVSLSGIYAEVGDIGNILPEARLFIEK